MSSSEFRLLVISRTTVPHCRDAACPHAENDAPICVVGVMNECFLYALALRLQLGAIGYVLPFATAATAKVKTTRLGAQWARIEHVDQTGFGILFLAFDHPHAHSISGNGSCHKDDVAVETRQRLAPVGELLDSEFDLVAAFEPTLFFGGLLFFLL